MRFLSQSTFLYSKYSMEASDSFDIPLFNSIFGLNKSFTKKLLVGLEFEDLTEKKYKPVVRLLANDFHGVKFTIDSWKQFTNVFDDVSKWFYEDSEKKLLDRKIYGDGWTIRYTQSHSNKTVEVEEDIRTPGTAIKRFRRSIVMAEVSFKFMKNYLIHCVDLKLKHLKSLCESASLVINCLLDHVYFAASIAQDAQVLVFSKKIVNDIIENREKVLEIIEQVKEESDKKIILLKDQETLSKVEIEILLFQIGSCKMHDIIRIFDNKCIDSIRTEHTSD